MSAASKKADLFQTYYMGAVMALCRGDMKAYTEEGTYPDDLVEDGCRLAVAMVRRHEDKFKKKRKK